MKKVILDTNVILSALIYKGKLRNLLDYVAKECILCISPSLISEVNDKLKNRFSADIQTIHIFLYITRFADVFSPAVKIDFPRDPDDAFLLELAEEAQADYIVTGDKRHLLPLKHWKNTKIVSTGEFIELIGKK